jgi:hypothetical protein
VDGSDEESAPDTTVHKQQQHDGSKKLALMAPKRPVKTHLLDSQESACYPFHDIFARAESARGPLDGC